MGPAILYERGSTVLITLGLILMLSAVGIMAVMRSVTDGELSFNQIRKDKAFQLSEAGLARAMAQLNADSSWRTGYANEPLGGGNYWVAVLDSSSGLTSGDTVILQTAGKSGGASVDLEAWMVPAFLQPFKYAALGDDSLFIGGGGCSDSYNSDSGTYASTWDSLGGDIGTNGSMSLQGGSTIGGDVSIAAGGTLDTGGGSFVVGNINMNLPPEPMVQLPESDYIWAESNNTAPAGLSGTGFTYDPVTHNLTTDQGADITLSDGVYFFDNIDLSKSTQFKIDSGANVTIYMTGDFQAGQFSTVNSGGDPPDLIIYSKGENMMLDQSTVFKGAFYGPNAAFEISQNTTLYGSIAAKFTNFKQGSCIHYDRSLGTSVQRRFAGFAMIGWREL